MGHNGINVAAGRAQRKLIERGYVTSRIVFQEQNIGNGLLTLTFLPGRIGSIRFAQADSRANAWNAVPADPGDILNLRDVEQALENFKRVPTVAADIQIVPANAADRSDLVIAWRQAFPFRLNATLDDSGSRATGKYQGSTTVSYDHWWTLNDLFYVTLSHDLGGTSAGERGTQGHTIHYSLPWQHWLLGFTQSSSRYHQSVAGFSQDYVYSGRNENAEIKLSRVLHRNASQKTSASLKGWLRRSSNFIDDTEVETQRRATGGWEIGLSHKVFVGNTSLDVNLIHKRGTAAFGAIPLASATVRLAAPQTVFAASYGHGHRPDSAHFRSRRAESEVHRATHSIGAVVARQPHLLLLGYRLSRTAGSGRHRSGRGWLEQPLQPAGSGAEVLVRPQSTRHL